MKLEEKLKLIFIIAIIVLFVMIGFIGIYVQDKGNIHNILPEYLLGMELKGYRKIELRMNTDAQIIKYDAEGKVIAESDTQTEVASSEEKKVNEDSIKTEENYKKVKKIIKKRLDKMGVKEYDIRQAENAENIIIQIPEDNKTDEVVAQLQLQGKFEMIDKDTNEVLMTNEDIEKVQAGYGSTSYGTSVALNIQFNKEGKEKFKNITNTYVEVVEEKAGEETETTEVTEGETKATAKEIVIKVDDSTLLTTHFTEEISNGVLQLSVGSSSNSTSEELQEYYEQAISMAALLDAGKMPIVYEIEQNKYVQTDITNTDIITMILVGVVILAVLLIGIIVKNKTKGVLASISLIGYIVVLTIVLRYTNVPITIEGIAGIVASILVEYVFLLSILKSKQNEFWSVYLKYLWILAPIAIMAILFILATMYLPMNSFGMVMFWGILTSFLWNAIITKNILEIEK